MQNPVLDGILQGLNMGAMLRREKLQQDLVQRQQARLDRDEELRGMETEMRFARMGARPLDEAGMVSDPIRFDGQAIPGMIGSEAIPKGAVIGETLRKGKAGQVVKYRGKSYEIPTEEEQQARALQLYKERQTADDESALNRQNAHFDHQRKVLREEQEAAAAKTPRVNVMDPNFLKAVPLNHLGAVANLRRTLAPDFKMTTDYVSGTPSFVGVDPVTNQPISVQDPAWRGAARPRPRQGAAGGSGGEGGSRQGSDHSAKEREQARKDLAALQKDEDGYHAEKISIGQRLKDGFSPDKKNPGKPEEERKKLHARLARLDSLIKAKQTAKNRIIERFGGGTGGGDKTANDPLGVRVHGGSTSKKNDPLGILD